MWIGLLILRLCLGVIFIGHGSQKLFGWFGGRGPRGTGEMFSRSGLKPGMVTAVIGGSAEAAGGALLILGALVPFASAAIATVMVGAIITVHARNGFWNTSGGYEYPLLALCTAIALAFTGPGRVSIDAVTHLALRGAVWGGSAIALTILGGCSILIWRELAGKIPDRPGDTNVEDHRKAA